MGGGGGAPPGSVPGASIQKLINTDRRKLVEILVLILKIDFGINLKDRFIWTIELCRI